MDGDYVMVPAGEYHRLCELEEFVGELVELLSKPEWVQLGGELAERLGGAR